MSYGWKEAGMYLHIGNGESIKTDKVIGIFDLDSATVSSKTRKFIHHQQKQENIEYADSDLPRSFVVYEENTKKYKIKLSRISAAGLASRAENRLSELSENGQ